MPKQKNRLNKANAFAKFSDISSGVIEGAKNYTDNVISGVKRSHEFAAEKANHLYQDAKTAGSDAIKKANPLTKISDISSEAIEGAKNYADNVISGVKRSHEFAAEKANHLYQDAKTAGSDAIKKANPLTKISDISSEAIEGAKNYADNVISGVKRSHEFAAEKANHLYQDARTAGSDAIKKANPLTKISDISSEAIEGAKNYADNVISGVKCSHEFAAEKANHLYQDAKTAGSDAIKKANAFAKISGISFGAIESAKNYADNVILGAKRGHGFAAEKANHLYDTFTGKDAKIVGGDNIKNGADRLVDGAYIQTKYCNSGSKCIAEIFENGKLRYLNTDGTPMQIEVPSDMHESAIQAMEERIKKGQVAGVTDPAKAKEIIRKGNFTYAQARNIARFGTIESITYDAVNGIKIAGTAFGISSAITFAVSIWNGKDWNTALKNACYDGLRVGGISWVGSLLTAQLGRTGIEQGLRGGTDWVVRQIGPKASAWLANGLRSGSNIYGATAMNHISKVLRGNIVTGAALTLILSSADFVRMFNGRVSGAQLFKNVTTTAASVAGGTGGWMGGAAAGAAIGSAIPILGTAAGSIIGGIFGSFAGGYVASNAASSMLDSFIEDDAKEMFKIVEDIFGQLAEDYLLIEKEATLAINELMQRDIPETLRDMYASDNRPEFARKILEPLIENQVKNRKTIKLPNKSKVIKQVGNILAIASA